MQFDDVYDLIKDNGDNIIDLTHDNNLEVIETQIKDKTIDFKQNDEIYLLTECLRVNEIRHTIFPMEYPPTSLEGIAVCYNIENWGSYEPAFENNIHWCKALHVLKDSIKNSTHTEVDMNKDLTQHNNEIARLQKSKEAKTYTKYLATLELKCPYNKSNCLGDFVVQKRSNNDPNATDMWFIGCSRWWEKEAGKGKHFFQRLKEDIDPILLGKLFNRESILVVLSTKSHSTKCGFLHQYTNGGMEEGKIIKKGCNVIFYKLIPYDLEKTPYVILVSKGIHTHPPPPPERTPQEVTYKLKVMIETAHEDLIDISPRKLISSNLIKATFGTDYLSQVHASLNDIDKLRRLISKVQKEHNPYGQGILGLTYDIWKGKEEYKDYVQQAGVFTDGQIIVICMSEKQAKAWVSLDYFEIDLTFKRVQGDINEFEVNCYNECYKIALTYVCVFTNITNSTSYERMFSLLFNWIYQLMGSNPKIFHIDNTGWKCILGDLDRAQAKGLGLALNRLYPNLTWEEHLTYIFKSCRIHYNRNIKNNKYPNNVKQLMYEYPNANTIERVEEIIQELKNSQEPNINDWILFYTISWVRASLNILYSFISEDTWYASPDNTNVAESCHANENRDGKSLSLEVAILRAKKYDERNFVTCQTQDQYGIRKTGKDHGVVMREKQAMLKRGQSSNKVESFTTQKGNKSRKVAKTHVIDDLEKEKQMISLKEKKLELEEKELKLEKEKLELEKERLELLKSKRELGFTE
ncbi:unnamed protein product [Rhizophagus irregularis]|nr:unnamed protein product [Rhizophagus irregularis]